MTYPNAPDPLDPSVRHPQHLHDVQQEVPVRSSLSKMTWAGLGFVILLLGGIAIWAYSSHNPQTASAPAQPGTEQTAPATTGQGGASSKMPVKDAR